MNCPTPYCTALKLLAVQCCMFFPKCVALVMFPWVITQDFVFVFLLLQFNII